MTEKEIPSESLHSKNYKKTLLTTFIFCLLVIISVGLFQFYSQAKVTNCSYLEPIIIDILAFIAAVFLVIEGLYRIHEHKNSIISAQFSRILRIALGCAIITIHVIQLIHK